MANDDVPTYIPLMQTAFHVMSLVAEARRELVGGSIVGSRFFKKARAAFLDVKSKGSQQSLGFLFHPTASGTIVLPSSKLNVDTTEKPWPIFGLNSGELIAIEQIDFDRLFRLTVKTDSGIRIIVVEAIGPNGNLWFLNEAHSILATLRNREVASNEVYAPPKLPDKLNPLKSTAETLHRRLEAGDVTLLERALEKAILGVNRTLSKEIVHRARLIDRDEGPVSLEECSAIQETLVQILAFFANPEKGLLYHIDGLFEAYPFRLASVAQEPEKFKSFSLAVYESTQRKQTASDSRDEKKDVSDTIARAIKRLEGRIVKLDGDIAHAQDFEQYKLMGDLLKIHFDEIRRGMSDINVENAFADSNSMVTIPLDSALTPNANVESYYQRHRKGKEGLEILIRRREVSAAELSRLREIQASLETNFEQARRQFAEEIVTLQPREGTKSTVQERLPYKPYLLSTGVTIFVGRDGADNDRTTFEFAKPFELWFHTQQCPGSHVVLKFPNKQFQPSKREIEEAASVAAWFSKARSDSLVPVCYTERRHVRKPRKAKPGLVSVEKEKSVMVVPRKPAE